MSSRRDSTLRHCMVVFAPYPLGETRVQREAEALVKHGYEVDVVCLRLPGDAAVDEYKCVKIYREKHRLPTAFSKGNAMAEKFLKYLRFFLLAGIRVTQLHFKKSYDSIQVHNLPDFLVFCVIIPKLLGVPIILDLHDLMVEFYAGRFGQSTSLIAKLIRWQEQLACHLADHVITVSEHWRQALIERGVPANKCSVVMNVADDQIFHPCDGDRYHEQLNKGFRLIYHGSIQERYGLDLAVQAINRVRDEIPGIHLLLVGAGPFLAALRELVNTLGLQEYVSITPLRLAEELPEIICSCDLGVVPYRSDVFTDGLIPTKLMEYAAMELPAIAARTTTIQAYFSDTNVEFFEPGNVDDLACCILKLYHNPARIAELARKSQNFNQRYNWTKIGAEYVAQVDRLRMGKATIAD